SNTADTIQILGRWDRALAQPESTSQFRVRGYEALPVPIVEVEVLDDDAPRVIVEQAAEGLLVAEHSGLTSLAAATYTRRLSKAPTADVTVQLGKAITATDPLEQLTFEVGGVQVGEVTFTPDDFGSKTVTVRAIADGVVEGRHFAMIEHSVRPGSAREFLREAAVTSLEFNGSSAAVVADDGNRLVIGFHGFQEGDPVVYSNGGSGENIGGLENLRTFFVVNPVETSIQLAESPGGRPIDLSPAPGGDRIEFAAFSAVDGKFDKIVLPLHPFSNGEEVVYTNAGAGPNVFGLESGVSYFVDR